MQLKIGPTRRKSNCRRVPAGCDGSDRETPASPESDAQFRRGCVRTPRSQRRSSRKSPQCGRDRPEAPQSNERSIRHDNGISNGAITCTPGFQRSSNMPPATMSHEPSSIAFTRYGERRPSRRAEYSSASRLGLSARRAGMYCRSIPPSDFGIRRISSGCAKSMNDAFTQLCPGPPGFAPLRTSGRRGGGESRFNSEGIRQRARSER